MEIGGQLAQTLVQRRTGIGIPPGFGQRGAHQHRMCGLTRLRRGAGRRPRTGKSNEPVLQLAQSDIAELTVAVNFGKIAPQEVFGLGAVRPGQAVIEARVRMRRALTGAGMNMGGEPRMVRAFSPEIGIRSHRMSRTRSKC